MAEERGKPIEKMTVKELRGLAKELGAESVSAMQKEELIEFIKKVRGEEKAPTKKLVKRAKKVLDVKEIKARIKVLKAQREELFAEGEREKAALLRKKISRLKKLSRRAARMALKTSS